jgi:hypothetical protein
MRRKFRNRRRLGSIVGRSAELTAGLLFLSIVVTAQPEPDIRARAMVDPITKSGFYRIVLPPQLVAKCRADLSDLRIYKPDGATVPYVLRINAHDRLNAGYLALPDPSIRRTDSGNKHSYYRLQYDDSYRIDRLSLMISDPILYKREVHIMAYRDSSDLVPVTSISIDPHDTAFRLPSVKARNLIIDIDNGDNPPLNITRVSSAQSGIYILTYLEYYSRVGFQLQTGQGEYGPPNYDLHYFTDSLTRHPLDVGLQPLQIDTLHRARRDTVAKATAPTVHIQNPISAARKTGLLLWSILTVILLLLTYVSVKLAKAVGKKEKE